MKVRTEGSCSNICFHFLVMVVQVFKQDIVQEGHGGKWLMTLVSHCSVHVVFGQVLSGADVVKKIEQLPTDARSRPEVEVKVTNCGELVLLKKGKGEEIFARN